MQLPMAIAPNAPNRSAPLPSMLTEITETKISELTNCIHYGSIMSTNRIHYANTHIEKRSRYFAEASP